jgi:hypothetical protein
VYLTTLCRNISPRVFKKDLFILEKYFMETIIGIFGSGRNLTVMQISCRAIGIFIVSLMQIRDFGKTFLWHQTTT